MPRSAPSRHTRRTATRCGPGSWQSTSRAPTDTRASRRSLRPGSTGPSGSSGPRGRATRTGISRSSGARQPRPGARSTPRSPWPSGQWPSAGRPPTPTSTPIALTNLGSLKIATGATSDGFALMEEASIAAVNGELSPFTSGVTACRMIGACRDLTDYRRASEWIEATESYCERQSLAGFPGVCRIHRAEVAMVGGAWARAEAGARARHHRTRLVQRHAAAGRRVLRDRRHPPPPGRFRGRRGRPS